MQSQQWYIHVLGETFGPVSTDSLIVMLQQNRIHFVDFVWTQDFTKWQRILDLDQFAHLVPGYPKAGIPKNGSTASYAAPEPAAAPSIELKSTQAPVREPAAERHKLAAVVTAEAPSLSVSSVKSKKTLSDENPAQQAKIRALPRIRVPGGRIEVAGQGTFDLIDLSENGLFAKADQPLSIGTEIKFTLTGEHFEKELVMTGVVIRHGLASGKNGFGVQFTRLNPAHKRIIHDLIQQRMAS